MVTVKQIKLRSARFRMLVQSTSKVNNNLITKSNLVGIVKIGIVNTMGPSVNCIRMMHHAHKLAESKSWIEALVTVFIYSNLVCFHPL